jgi:hypothetical protein
VEVAGVDGFQLKTLLAGTSVDGAKGHAATYVALQVEAKGHDRELSWSL